MLYKPIKEKNIRILYCTVSFMIDPKRFKSKLSSFPSNYMRDFDQFWKWKLETETGNEHLLDDTHLEETVSSQDYYKLPAILRRWQVYRKCRNRDPYRTLQDSLRKMSDVYNRIRNYSLLEFDVIPEEELELIWNELGYVKDGKRDPTGRYLIISICKPLMLMWGQTLAFDTHVRENSPRWVPGKYRYRWSFEQWKSVMETFQEGLKQHSEVVVSFKEVSQEKYKTDLVVPYGRFLDIYYY